MHKELPVVHIFPNRMRTNGEDWKSNIDTKKTKLPSPTRKYTVPNNFYNILCRPRGVGQILQTPKLGRQHQLEPQWTRSENGA